MPSPKKKIEVEPEHTEEEIENNSLELQSVSLEAQAQKELSPNMVKALKKIAYYTAKVGLTLKESCVLVDIDYEKFLSEMRFTPLISKIIQMKELQYKKDLMYTISQKAKSGDDKLAQWLLERRYPDEFGTKKAIPPGDGEDLIFQALQIIRRKGDSNSLVNPNAGHAVVVTRASLSSGEVGPAQKITDILNG